MVFTHHKDIRVLHEGDEEPRAYFIPYESEKNATRGVREDSPYFKSLCGEWDFKHFDSEAAIDVDLTDPALGGAENGFCPIPVPMNWQVKDAKAACEEGFDPLRLFGDEPKRDVPNYTNINYPFPCDPPYIPNENPCAVYTRRFFLTEGFAARELYLNFEGVDSCFYLFLNGNYVGYSTVSHSTTEFAVSRFLREGENTVTLLVFKWCSSSYLEDQDMWRFSGIFR